MNLIELVRHKAEQYGDKVFLLGEGGPVSYAEFDRITDRLAARLIDLGVKPGERVAVLHRNSAYVFEAYFAAVKARAVAVPVNPIYTPPEVAHNLGDSGAVLLLAYEDLAPKAEQVRGSLPALKQIVVLKKGQSLEEALEAAGGKNTTLPDLPEATPDTPAFTFYTSGTTGKPKGVILCHRNIVFGGCNIAQNYGLRKDDVAMGVLPMVHIFCIASPFMGSFCSGGTVAVMPSFSPETALQAIGQYKVTWLPGVPTMFSYLLNTLDPKRHDVSSLRMGLSGGASIPLDLMNRWMEAFGARVQEAYGLTESVGLVATDPVYGEKKPGSIGIVASGVQARLVDKDGNDVPDGKVGHLIFKGPNRMVGYHNLPEVTAERVVDGWFYTGDHAYRDDDGYLFIAGRESELIITAGYNVYPREIEEVLYSFPGVAEAAVISVPDDNKGEAPLAFVAMAQGAAEDAETLLQHCRQNLAPYKIPLLRFMTELPKNPTGKILKNQLPKE